MQQRLMRHEWISKKCFKKSLQEMLDMRKDDVKNLFCFPMLVSRSVKSTQYKGTSVSQIQLVQEH